MTRTILKIGIISSLCVSLVAVTVSAHAAESNADPKKIIEDLMQWWPGDYNNDQQVSELIAAGKPIWRADGSGEGGHIQVESHYRKVDIPQFGEHVLYVEEFKHGDQNNIFRQRIYSLSIDQQSSQVKVKLWYFNDKKKYVGAWKGIDLLADLSKEQMFALPDSCDLTVSKQGEQYHMPMTNRACAFGKQYFNYQVLLGPDSFWFKDKINLLADDSLVSTAGDFTYHELDRYDPETE